MLNLEELVFKVNTKELTEAVTEIQNLGKAVIDLGNKTATVNVKVKKTDDAVKAQTKAVKESTEETKKNISVLERQQDILKFMADGFSKGQASILATAKAAGTAAAEMKVLMGVVKDQRTLMGTDPFDKSIGGLQALENELAVVTKSYELHGRQLGLTQKQATELARDYIRLRQQFIITKKDLAGLDAEYEKLVQAEVKVATAQNKLVQEMKAQDKAAKDTAKANEYLAKEMERVNRMMGNTQDITSTTNNKLIKFEEALKKSGMTAAQQTAALDKYKKSLLEIQQAGGNRQVDYLSRALGPQITDVFVGLATGQSPLMVLLQQGGQLRDQFALAGVAGADMGKMLTQAAASMLVSVKDVAMAVGGLMVNAILGASKAIANMPFQLLKAMGDSLVGMFSFAKSGGKDVEGLSNAFTALATTLTKATMYAGGFAAAIGIAFISARKDINELNNNLVMTGASLGMTATDAYTFAQSMESSGVSTFKAINALSAFAKEGVVPAEGALKDLIIAATELQSVGGPAVEETAKKLAEIGKSPTEALVKFATQTGVVDIAILKQVASLEKQKKFTEAAELAQRAFIEGTYELSAAMYANLTPAEKLWMGVKKATSDAWSAVKEFANSDAFLTPFKLMLQTAWVLVSEVWYVVKAIGKELGGIAAQIVSVLTTRSFDGAKAIREEMLADSKRAREEQDAYTKSIIEGTVLQGREQKKTGDQLKANAAAAREFARELKEKDKTASASLDIGSDNTISNIEKRYNRQLKLAQEFAKNDMAIQKAMLDAGLITQEEYYSNTIDLVKQSEQQQLEVVDKYSSEYQSAVQARMVQLAQAYIETINSNKGLKGETEKNAEATKNYNQAVDNVLESLQTFTEKNDGLRQSIENNGVVRDIENFAKYQKAIKASSEAYLKYAQEVDNSLSNSDVELKNLDMRLSLLGKTEDEQKLITREYDRQAKLAKAIGEYEAKRLKILNDKSFTSETDRASALIDAYDDYAEKVRVINKDTAVLAAEDYQREFNKIQSTITDIIATALFEGGKAGQQKLKDVLKAAFRRYVIDVFINPVVKGGMNMIANVLGLSSGGSSSGGGFNGFGGASFGSNVAGMAQDAGIWALNNGMEDLGSALWENSAAIGEFADFAGDVFGYANALNSFSEGKYGTAVGQAIGTYFGGPIGAWIGGEIGSLLDPTPGEQHQGGMYSTRGSELNMDTARSITGGGGWDDGAWARDLTERGSEQVSGALKTIVDGALGQVNDAIKVFGMGPFTIDAGFAANVNGQGSDPNSFGYFNLYDEAGNLVEEYINRELGDDLTAAIAKFGGDIQEAVASVVLEGTNFKREGETNVQTLARLSTSLTAVNQVADLLGMESLDLTLAGGDAASSLVDLYGSIENLQSASQNFYDQFANDTIKLADAQARLDSTFGDLGLSIPATRDEFYTLVQGLDLSTEAGQAAYAALLGVGDAFLYVESSAQRAREEAERQQEEAQREAERAYQDAQRAREEAERLRKEAIQKAFDALQKAVSKQREGLKAQYDLAKQVYEIASQAARELRGQVGNSNQMLIGEARNLIDTALTSGQLPDPKLLSEAIIKVREELENTQYKSKVEQDKATLLLSNDLQKIADLAEPQMTTAELQLQQLELILEQQKALVDAALGNTEATLSVGDAIVALATALANRGGTSSGSGGSGQFVTGGGGGKPNNSGYLSGTTSSTPGATQDFYKAGETFSSQVTTVLNSMNLPAYEATINGETYTASGGGWFNPDEYLDKNPDITAYLDKYGYAGTNATNDEEFAQWHFATYGIAEGRKYANGGAFTNGIVKEPTAFNMGLMGEAGSEAIMPLTNVGGSLGVRATNDPSLVEAIDRMNSNLEMLRSEIRADVSHNAKTSRLLDRVIQDGRTISVTADLDGGTI